MQAALEKYKAADELLTPESAGVYLGGHESPISPKTLQTWRTNKQPPVWIKMGKFVRYRRSDLDAYRESCLTTVSGGRHV